MRPSGPGDLRRRTSRQASDLRLPALRAFFGVATAWSLDEREQMQLLGISSRSTLQSWKAGRVSRARADTIERISYVLGIFRAINILLPDERRADAWLRAPNKAPLFGGRSALDRMTAGRVGDLYVVRRYLSGELS